ncbi:MAG: methyltransferase [Sphingomonadales bacterium]|nr:methyltransferase [Sphingomonadales bacterium]
MHKIMVLAAATVAIAVAPPAAAKPAGAIAAAVADSGRPAEDTARDGLRKPAEMLAFAGVRPGMKVGELLPGAGYFSRVIARTVGAHGKVYAYIPGEGPGRGVDRYAPVAAAYRNIAVVRGAAFSAPEKLDLVWTTQNYHDLHHKGGNAEAVNAAAFAALKPGGTYLVSDHRARPGSYTADVDALHRIDEATVILEVEKAGFVMADESYALRRADDDHTKKPFDMHDQTDQFVLKFVKPAR